MLLILLVKNAMIAATIVVIYCYLIAMTHPFVNYDPVV